jgi:DNA topoisomerase I
MKNFQLKYIAEHCEGIKRIRRGKGFLYLDEDGERIDDPAFLQWIKSLGIPPNWKNVWICPELDGHIQATGLDIKNRKQYIYHPEWRKYRSTAKFDKLKEFAQWLPTIRKKAYKDIQLPEWPRNKVLGLIILTLDEAHIRIGNTFYRDENETFGLTTLRRRHLHFEKKSIIFEFKAKSGKYSTVNIKNNKLVKLIKECSELPGYEVFRYRENGTTIPVTSADVNQYLKEISLEDFSSKDFRTWGGTVLAVEKFPEAKKMVEENKRLKLEPALVKLVAAELGNTQSICRDYYIHPAILQAVQNGDFDKLIYEEEKAENPFELTSSEKKALEIIGGKIS